MRLDDKYTQERGRVYLTGIQALVRLPIDQMRLDRRAGLNTGAFISGYEGSPLGGYDLALESRRQPAAGASHPFRPGRERGSRGDVGFRQPDPSRAGRVEGRWRRRHLVRQGSRRRSLRRHFPARESRRLPAATAPRSCWPATIIPARARRFRIRATSALTTSACRSCIPATRRRFSTTGCTGIALSRYSGAWAAMKLVTNVCDGGGTVDVDPERRRFTPAGGHTRS